MSFRGFAKAVARLPQQVKAKAGYAEETVDEEFDQLYNYYEQFKDFISKLKEDAQKFKRAMDAMLQHQRTFSSTFLDVQTPIPILSGSNSNASASNDDLLNENQKIKRVSSDPATANAVQLYINSLDEIITQITQDLTVVDRRVVQPINELQTIFRSIDKIIVKRGHKLLDFDRHRNELQRAKTATSTNTTKDLKEERKFTQLESNLQLATQEYTHLNDTLKQQLPQFLQYRLEFIGPCFQTLYFLQRNIYQTILNSLEPVQRLQRYDFTHPILTTYDTHKLQIDQWVDQLSLLKPKLLSSNVNPSANPTGGVSTHTATAPKLLPTDLPNPPPNPSSSSTTSTSSLPPPYVVATTAAPTMATSSVPGTFPRPSSSSSISSTVPIVPLPVPTPLAHATTPKYVVAQFDFPGQQPDDLAFRVGDQILVLEATNTTNDWWKGQLNGKVGYFPANYVK